MRAAILPLALALSAPAGAQELMVGSFGADDSIAIVGTRSFHPEEGGVGTFSDHRWSTLGGWLAAPLDFLPNGSRITRIAYYFHDSDATENLEFFFCQSRFDADSGADLEDQCLLQGDSAGVDGESYIVDVDPRDILYRRDIDGNGTTDIESFYLLVHTPAGDLSTSIRAAEVRWKRRISPAPLSATFNDVPTKHPFFQFIEALYDSGITAGCGSGNYCPDAPLTRGQMAVFLAKALGLHWPWDAQ